MRQKNCIKKSQAESINMAIATFDCNQFTNCNSISNWEIGKLNFWRVCLQNTIFSHHFLEDLTKILITEFVATKTDTTNKIY